MQQGDVMARQQAEEKLATGLWEIGGVITVVQP